MRSFHYFFFVVFLLASGFLSHAQRQEIAKAASFDDLFFDALQYKATDQQDKAIIALEKCDVLYPKNKAVLFELAKNHYIKFNYNIAQQYAMQALELAPDNPWILTLLYQIYRKQQNTASAIVVVEQLISLKHTQYQSVLLELYATTGAFDKAITYINTLEAKGQADALVLAKRDKYLAYKKASKVKKQAVSTVNPVDTLQLNILSLLENKQYQQALIDSEHAIERYAAQPVFYYTKGVAAYHLKQLSVAIASLQTALDYLIEDAFLQQQIYKALVACYNDKPDLEKKLYYQNKIK